MSVEITDEQKAILKAINIKDLTLSEIAKDLSRQQISVPNLGTVITDMVMIGLIQEVDGEYFLDDVGHAAGAIEGNELPDEIFSMKSKAPVIDKPGTAMAKYQQSLGEQAKPKGPGKEAYERSLQRQNEPKVNAKFTSVENGESGPTDDRPTPPEREQVSYDRLEKRKGARQITKQNTDQVICPLLLYAVPINFCISCCKLLVSINTRDSILECEG